MKILTETINPILNDEVANFKAQWDEKYPNKNPSWWKIWKKRESNLKGVVSFLINCLDELIIKALSFKNMSGVDKKAIVLAAVASIYDYIVKEALPIWLVPVAGRIKYIVIYIVLSYMIDFICNKYKTGLWRENNEKEQSQ